MPKNMSCQLNNSIKEITCQHYIDSTCKKLFLLAVHQKLSPKLYLLVTHSSNLA